MAHNSVLFNVPTPRQEWVDGKFIEHDHSHEESWVELFIDLVYVLLLSSFAHALDECEVAPVVFLRSFFIFWIICLTRNAVDEFSNRFFSHDMMQMALSLVYAIAVCIQVFSFSVLAHDNKLSKHVCKDPSYITGFAVSVVLTRLCLALFYAPILYSHPHAWAQFRLDIFRWTLTVALMIIVICIAATKNMTIGIEISFLGLVCFVETGIWIVSRVFYRRYFVLPINLETLQSRLGTWVLMILGEIFLQFLHAVEESVETWHHGAYRFLVFVVVAIIFLYCLGMQYFDACHVKWYVHALTKSALAGVSWVWLHVPMTYFLFRMGLFMYHLAESYATQEHLSSEVANSFSLCIALVTILKTFIRMTNAMPDESTSLLYHVVSAEFRVVATYVLRFLVGAIQLSLIKVHFENGFDLLLVHCGLAVFITFVDVYISVKNNESLRADEEARKNSNIAIRSLRQFPRQWSKLQIMSKESALQMNIVQHDSVHQHTAHKTGVDDTPASVHQHENHSGLDTGSGAESRPDLRKEIQISVLRHQQSIRSDSLSSRGDLNSSESTLDILHQLSHSISGSKKGHDDLSQFGDNHQHFTPRKESAASHGTGESSRFSLFNWGGSAKVEPKIDSHPHVFQPHIPRFPERIDECNESSRSSRNDISHQHDSDELFQLNARLNESPKTTHPVSDQLEIVSFRA